jgi:hypothetical protein
MRISGQPTDIIENFRQLIPHQIDPELKNAPNDFSRNRNLNFQRTIALTLSMTVSGGNQGVDIKSGQFFKNARRSELWPDAQSVHRSNVTRARQKVPYQVFQNILSDSVALAYDIWPQDDDSFLWNNMSVFATDGSKFNLPATEELRKLFDPDSGLETNGKGHYPQCLVSTLYDVFRRLPVARTVVSINGSEREEMKNLLPFVPVNSVWMFDRGYPAYETILHLYQHYSGYWLFRCPASGTFSAVEKFIKNGKQEDIIYLNPSNSFRSKVSLKERKKLKSLKIRIIRLESPDGTISVLLTNLFGRNKFEAGQIQDLYYIRWRVEEYYRDEKVTFDIERFHSKTENGIMQELYSAMIMSVIARCCMVISTYYLLPKRQEVQFKNAIIALAADAAIFVPDDPVVSIKIFKELLTEIARVKYYRPKKQRPPQPRVNKRPLNKWQQNKRKKSETNA